MFSVKKQRSALFAAPSRTTALVAAAIVFLIGATLASVLARAVESQSKNDYELRMSRQTSALRIHLANSIENYNHLLISTAALYNMQETVTADTWRQFYENMKVDRQYPELTGLGFTQIVHNEDLEAYMSEQNAWLENFVIQPDSSRSEKAIITFLEPMSEENKSALGFDMLSEESRRQAMFAARDSGRTTMTSPIRLVQAANTADTSAVGVLLYAPIYKTRTTPNSVAERREQLKGYAYVVVRPKDVIDAYLATTPAFDDGVNIDVADVTNGKKSVFSLQNAGTDKTASISKSEQDMYLDGRQWMFEISGRNAFINAAGAPGAIFALGTAVSVLAGLISFQVLYSRMRHIEKGYEIEVQKSKEELLALASHQLRTPASGVKQYLGLLTDGFVGELSAQQLEVAKKAQNANERQLEIINELLYVSKIDAGQLHVEPREVDMRSLVQSVIDSFSQSAKDKDIKLKFVAKRPYKCLIDDRYMIMAIENLISNAIKYSHANTTVNVKLRKSSGNILLSVIDEGVGLSKDDQQRVFRKFERVSNALSRSEGGSGLGLFLAKELAIAHGGDISIVSEPGKGSTFTLSLPCNKAEVQS